MVKIKIFQVDAFTNNLFSGNPAAVCFLNNWLPDEIMQSIALENNLSETAFFIKKKDKFFIRWFTPKVEIDLCGHATLASAHIIYSEMNYKCDYIEFNTKSGDILSVNRINNLLNMNFPAYKPKIADQSLDDLYDAFGIRPTLFLYCKYGLAVFNNEEEIIKIIPKLNVIKKLPYDGIIITAPGENVDFVSRFFAPKFGIPEDPVTGGAHCELIPYWSKRLNKKNMIAKQVSKRGGVIYCSYLGDRVIIGGKAITYMQGELLLGIKR
jgi:PhzF family phenazine biosynthesis protein